MKKALMILMALFFMIVAGCGGSNGSSGNNTTDTGDDSSDDTVLSSENGISAFSVEGVEGEIDLEAGTITVYLPYDLDFSSLVASFTTTGESVSVDSTVQVSGTTANDFSSPVTYTVTAEDGATRTFTVTVIEADRYQVFESSAGNLLDGSTVSTTNRQIYLHDLKTGENTLVSEGSDGMPSSASWSCSDGRGTMRSSVTPDGRYVVYDSNATNMVETPAYQGYYQVYLKDMQTEETTLVSMGYDGNMSDGLIRSASISDDGDYIVFSGCASNIVEGAAFGNSLAYLYERETGDVSLVSETYDGNPADNCTHHVRISGNGRYVVFDTATADIVEGVSSSYHQVYRRDLETGATSLVSVGYDGGSHGDATSLYACVSRDGRYVVFCSDASNLIDGFPGSGYYQVFLRDMETGTTSLVSVGYDGNPASGACYYPYISPDGSHVAFYSEADNLVDGVSSSYGQIYVRDIDTGATSLASVAYDGNPASGSTNYPMLSSNGSVVFFASDGDNLLEGDDADNFHVYARDMTAGTTSKIDVNTDGTEGDSDAYTSRIWR